MHHMPNRMKAQLAKKHAKLYIINATKIAQEIGMGRRTNTILQSAFFALNEQIMPRGDFSGADEGLREEVLRQEGRCDRTAELQGDRCQGKDGHG